jgi:hypothetical protein
VVVNGAENDGVCVCELPLAGAYAVGLVMSGAVSGRAV